MKEPLVYIVTINWNGFKDTVECINSLREINYENFKVVIIDNGSKNNEADKLKKKFPNIPIIRNKKNEGFCKANNQGINYALQKVAEYVLILNNDTVPRKDFLSILVEKMQKDKKLGVCGPVIKYYKSDKVWFGGSKRGIFGLVQQDWKGRKYSDFKREVRKQKEVPFITGCALFMRSSVLKKIGVLDEIYFAYVEDVDFSFRVRKAGYRVQLVPESVIEHKKSASAGESGSKKFSKLQTYLIGRNEVVFTRKNLKGIEKVLYVLGLLTVKLIYFMLQADNLAARKEHLVGLKDGFLQNLNVEKWFPPKRLFVK